MAAGTVDLEEFVSPSKRRKLSTNRHSLLDFIPGSIIKIKLINFMSYSLTEFQMSPYLNMIIGPNGTGKSTIVCAICIGLAGKFEYLGKPNMQINQFIKTGQDSATIEIELKGKESDDTINIRREMIAATGKSNWFQNGKQSNEKQIKELVRDLDIQLDNLCQFLAQDRVSKFASQKPNELLKEIERSYKNGELLHEHQQLIELSNTKIKLDVEIEEIEQELSRAEKLKESLHADVEKYKKFQEKKQDLQMHQNLIPFVQIQDAKARLQRAKEERDLKIAKYRAFEEKIKPISNLIDRFSDDSNELHEEISRLEKKLNKYVNKVDQYKNQIEEFETAISDKEEELKNKLVEIVRKKQHLSKERSKLEDLKEREAQYKTRLISNEDLQEYNEKRSEIHQQIKVLEREIINLESDVGPLRGAEKNLERIIKRNEQQLNSKDKIQVLNNRDQHSRDYITQQAIYYLRDNKDKFPGVFEPPVVSLDVHPRYATILSNIVSYDAQLAFTAIDEKAYNIVSKILLDQLKINVSLRQLSRDFQYDKFRIYSKEELHKFGFDGYLSDFIKGPSEVIQMVCEQNNIQCIPVSVTPLNNQQISAACEPLPNGEVKFNTFVSGDQIFYVNKSIYGKQQIYTSTGWINQYHNKFNNDGLSEEARSNIQSQIAKQKEELTEIGHKLDDLKERRSSRVDEIQNLKIQYKDVDSYIKDAKETTNRYTKAQSVIQVVKETIGQLEAEIEEISEQNSKRNFKKEVQQSIRDLIISKLESLNKMVAVFKEVNEIKKQITFKTVTRLQQDNKKISIEGLIKETENKKLKYLHEAEEAKRSFKQLKQDTFQVMSRLNDVVRETFSDEERENLALLARRYINEGQFEESLIRLKIDQIKTEMASFDDSSASSISRLTSIEKKIENFNGRLPDLKIQQAEINTKIQTIEEKWLPELEKIILKISKKFNKNFSMIASAGEVQLNKNFNSYDEWRLEIMVQFRDNSPLVPLDGTTQSGGEKSVSTAIFLNSLQGLTNSPFRVVDEINQGMDARNERKIHEFIVQSACKSEQNFFEDEEFNSDNNQPEKISQYFLITPKLLTDLYYHEKMSVHCIMSGRYCPDPIKDEKLLGFGITESYIQRI